MVMEYNSYCTSFELVCASVVVSQQNFATVWCQSYCAVTYMWPFFKIQMNITFSSLSIIHKWSIFLVYIFVIPALGFNSISSDGIPLIPGTFLLASWFLSHITLSSNTGLPHRFLLFIWLKIYMVEKHNLSYIILHHISYMYFWFS